MRANKESAILRKTLAKVTPLQSSAQVILAQVMFFAGTIGPLRVNCCHWKCFTSPGYVTAVHQPTMPAGRHLNLVDRGRALACLQEGIWLRVTAARLDCSHSVIMRLQQRFQPLEVWKPDPGLGALQAPHNAKIATSHTRFCRPGQ